MDLIESHTADPRNITQLATLSGTSARHLRRVFERHAGITLMRFYRNVRLDKARELLVQTGLPVPVVALATGFANGAHFARAFGARFGARPSGLRSSGLSPSAGTPRASAST